MSTSAYVGQPPISYFDYYVGIAYGFGSKKPFNPVGQPATVPFKENIQSRAYLLYANAYTAAAVIITTTLLRLYVRYKGKLRPRFGLDDWLIIPAMILGIANAGFALSFAYAAGGGKHVKDVTYLELSRLIPLIVCNSVVTFAYLMFVKLSILMFYRRLTSFANGYYQIVIWIMTGLVIAWGTISCVMFAFQCKPVRAAYDMEFRGRHIKTFKCFNATRLTRSVSWGHAATDIILIILPIYVVSRLQMPLSSKIRICALFCVAFISIACSIVRNTKDTLKDPTWDLPIGKSVIWGSLDTTTAIVVANLPALNYFVTGGRWRGFSTRVRSAVSNLTSRGSRHTPPASATDSISGKDDTYFKSKEEKHVNVKEANHIGVERDYAVTTGDNPGDIEKGLDWGRGATSANAKSP